MSKPSRIQFSVSSVLIAITIAAVFFAAMRVIGVAPLVAILIACAGSFAFMLFVTAIQRSIVTASSGDPASPQSIASVPGDFEASLIIAKLAANGIRANAVGGFTSGFQTEAPGVVSVVVALQDVKQAQQILDNFEPEEYDVDWSKVDTGDSNDD